MRTAILMLVAVLAAAWTSESLADPPPHAPAHGWRNKHDPHYVGYTGVKWEHDYEVSSGHCNREAIGAVLGGVAGGAIGSQIGDGDGRTVATIIGAAVGALIGAKVGRGLDDRDRDCVGHVLEIGRSGYPVRWQNRTTGVRYELTPGEGSKGRAGACRSFTLVAASASQHTKQHGKACQSKPGVWRLDPL